MNLFILTALVINDYNARRDQKGTKGVPHSCDLVIENFLNKLYGSNDHSVQLRSLRVLRGKMSTLARTIAIIDYNLLVSNI